MSKLEGYLRPILGGDCSRAVGCTALKPFSVWQLRWSAHVDWNLEESETADSASDVEDHDAARISRA